MTSYIQNISLLIRSFLSEEITATQLRNEYNVLYKSIGRINDLLYDILDKYYYDLDLFTTDDQLISEGRGAFIDEAELRRLSRMALSRLDEIVTGPGS